MEQRTGSLHKQIAFSSDNFLLKGTLHLPGNIHKPPVIIGSHGLFSSADSPKQIELAQKCNDCGIAYFRFNHRGCGKSEGAFNDVTSLGARCNDLISAVEAIRVRDYIGDKMGLFGSSMGGAVCLAAAGMLDDIASMVTVAAPVRIRSNARAIEAIKRSAGPNRPDPSFYEKNLQFDISNSLSEIQNILIFHGEADDVIPLSHAKEIYEKVSDPKRLIVQKGGDHRISDKEHQKEFIRETVAWFKRELGN